MKLANGMLRPTTYPDSRPPLKKVVAHEKSAKGMNEKFRKTAGHIVYEDGPNHLGVEQHACIACGDCVTGCNHNAKSTTQLNYLPDARNHGTEIYTQVSVRYVERKNGKWIVRYQLLNTGQEKFNAPLLAVYRRSADPCRRHSRIDRDSSSLESHGFAVIRPRWVQDERQWRRAGVCLQL